MARKLPKPLAPPAASAAVHGQQEVTTETFLTQLSPAARARLEREAKIMAEVRAFAKDNPEDAGRLIRVWLSKRKV